MATQLTRTLTGRGRRVAVIAASVGPLGIDTPGKDSYEHAAAGARDVVVVSGRRWARVHRNDPTAPPRLAALAGMVEGAEIVLALGFGEPAELRLTVQRDPGGATCTAPPVLAEEGRGQALRLDNPEAIADLIERLSEESSQHE